ncbi:phage head closure protein [Enterobacter huaxiensis]|uniref:phage head closure protein n=1 Tax=Enterobacter huaxiensis TaxID=2494702 RepID=UPI0021760B9E|nr:phage head closure protein [Enterobacter huaxiensis]MCS5452500.1 phage head closure protein [Enterobacter huaxiensis]
MGLSPGKLRHAVTFQQRISYKDSFGAMVNSWEDVYKNIPASVEPLSARDFIASDQFQSKITARIVIRYKPDITPAMRILFRGAVYNIAGILPDLNSGLEYLTIPVSVGVDKS